MFMPLTASFCIKLLMYSVSWSAFRGTGIQIPSCNYAIYKRNEELAKNCGPAQDNFHFQHASVLWQRSTKSIKNKPRGVGPVPLNGLQEKDFFERCKSPLFLLVHLGAQEFRYCQDVQKQSNRWLGNRATTSHRPNKTNGVS